MTTSVWSIERLDFEESSYTQLPGAQITNICMQGKFPYQPSFPSQP